MNKFSVVKCQVGEKNKNYLIMNPSKISSYSDIEKLLKEVKSKQGNKKIIHINNS